MRTADRALAKKMAYIKKLNEGVQPGDVFLCEGGHPERGFPPAVVAAARYFGLDLSDSSHRVLLLYTLSDLLFGKSKPGRPSKRKWDEEKLLRLGTLYDQIKCADPDLSDSKIAKLIHADHKKEFQSCENVRQNLAEAKETFCDSLRRSIQVMDGRSCVAAQLNRAAAFGLTRIGPVLGGYQIAIEGEDGTVSCSAN